MPILVRDRAAHEHADLPDARGLGRGRFLENFEVPLRGTACESVLSGQVAHYPEHIQDLFPEDVGLKGWGVESYSGVPLLDSEGTCSGHLAIFDDKPMHDGPRGIDVMRIFAARALVVRQRDGPVT